ncbi:hypothetical protein [Lacipirellula parvula]|uniref:Carboxypeptidase regulatory-like domain-containing protein n=1 Tax=Lacipirellula parvula TaxID=2650471 RepID=A0A5K7XK45_9BACT|nr:hypothetical protein [Lacipirellula parvula]BBO34633.1 hypothetical protein PLANPX_4245 [Lacipirellula parvula]
MKLSVQEVRATGMSLLAVASSLLFAVGCGNSSAIDKVVVSGVVTLDGQPISNGEIRFIPTSGTIGPVSGGAIKDGAYTAQAKGGVPIGTHQVEIKAYRANPKSKTASAEGGAAEQFLDARYNAQTTLTATIEPDTETKDFQLTSK